MAFRPVKVSCLFFLIFLLRRTTVRDVVWMADAYVELSPQEFYDEIEKGNKFDVIADVRTLGEWNMGRIASDVTAHVETTTLPDALKGCEKCNIVLYCRSGSRAAAALRKLEAAGFTGKLYNGFGTTRWINAGYPLSVTQQSVAPYCTTNPGKCRKQSPSSQTKATTPTKSTTTTTPVKSGTSTTGTGNKATITITRNDGGQSTITAGGLRGGN